MTAHWSVPDPAAVTASEDAQRRAFKDALRALDTRIKLFVALPMEKLDRMALQRSVRQIGDRRPQP